jgi:quinol monooxygenase YgiN
VRPDSAGGDELIQSLCELAKQIRKERGCVVCAVCLEESHGFFLVVSAWNSAADLHEHLRSEPSQVLSGVSPLSGATAEVAFLTFNQ